MARQPSSSAAVTKVVTITKLSAVPAELALRSAIPTTTVHNHTTTPVGASECGRRQPRETSHPTNVPVRNGQEVSARPAMLNASE